MAIQLDPSSSVLSYRRIGAPTIDPDPEMRAGFGRLALEALLDASCVRSPARVKLNRRTVNDRGTAPSLLPEEDPLPVLLLFHVDQVSDDAKQIGAAAGEQSPYRLEIGRGDRVLEAPGAFAAWRPC